MCIYIKIQPPVSTATFEMFVAASKVRCDVNDTLWNWKLGHVCAWFGLFKVHRHFNPCDDSSNVNKKW